MKKSSVSPHETETRSVFSSRRYGYRRIKDIATRCLISLGGVGVILAVALIFVYLLYEVVPLFKSARIDSVGSFQTPAIPKPVAHVLIDELARVAGVVSSNGNIQFLSLESGDLLLEHAGEAQAVAVDPAHPERLAFAQAGGVQLVNMDFQRKYFAGGRREVQPNVVFPYGEELLPIEAGGPIKTLAFRETSEAVGVAVLTVDGKLMYNTWEKSESFLSGEITLSEGRSEILPLPNGPIKTMMLGPDMRWLFLVKPRGVVEIYDLKQAEGAYPYGTIRLEDKNEITAIRFLLGGFSLLIGDNHGGISQWMPVRDVDNHYDFVRVRQFNLSDHPIVNIEPEQRRKGFVAADATGMVGLFYTTSHRTLLKRSLGSKPFDYVALSPRADFLWLLQQGESQLLSVDNQHPEVSWSSLWQKVWYEGYAQPEYIWQSSAATNDFEPKFSLTPLTYGTLKAAFYAMLLAMPLAICGAIFTAYFMAPALRKKVKPAIELMEALPTVILGFLAGLWLAPLIEQKLPGIILMLFLTPVFILIFAYLYSSLPARIRLSLVPEGWQPILLIPAVILSVLLCMWISNPLQIWLFGGDIREWLTHTAGIDYDQRNALVVGFAMGFAVIPTIFSIAEDAVFAVPKHLSYGSLALGATPWQTLVRVVLPTASPGIFSGVMIGFGRAVGETMIVLMATGNTPIMDMNIFEGFRTLSANIAVEMPEAEVDSTHFRILFLAALVLFAFTFVLNTTAEFVRQRLRERYGSL